MCVNPFIPCAGSHTSSLHAHKIHPPTVDENIFSSDDVIRAKYQEDWPCLFYNGSTCQEPLLLDHLHLQKSRKTDVPIIPKCTALRTHAQSNRIRSMYFPHEEGRVSTEWEEFTSTQNCSVLCIPVNNLQHSWLHIVPFLPRFPPDKGRQKRSQLLLIVWRHTCHGGFSRSKPPSNTTVENMQQWYINPKL